MLRKPASQGHSIALASRLSGVPIETLRAWERRYGFPRPARVEGTHRRLYSESDIARLRWVSRALARGFRAGDVVPREATEIEALLGETTERPTDAAPPAALPETQDLVRHLTNDDVSAFDVELRRLAGALGPKAFVTEVAHPLTLEIGRAWEAGTLEVRQEHYASEALAAQLRLVLGTLQDVSGSPVVVLATLPDELHGLGLAMVAVLLALHGAKPRILGVNTPVDQIAEAAEALHADVVGLSITPFSLKRNLEAQLRTLERALPRKTHLWLGGRGAREVARSNRREVVTDWAGLDEALERARRGGLARTPRAGADR